MQAGIRENVRFIKKKESDHSLLVTGTFGLHASLTLSDSSLDACRSAASSETGFHIHAAEQEADEYDSLNKTGLRVIDRLQKHNILGRRTNPARSEEHTSELQSPTNLLCRLLVEKKKFYKCSIIIIFYFLSVCFMLILILWF